MEHALSIPYDKMQLGLDSVSSISLENNLGIDPKKLICAICYCINFKGKQCKNDKCNKVFCDSCYRKNLAVNCGFKCPYCRISRDVSNMDFQIENAISSLLFYCKQSKYCTKQYTVAELYLNHSHVYKNTVNDIKCSSCQSIINETNYNNSKCNNCLKIGCYQNTVDNKVNKKYCMTRCSSCKSTICSKCNSDNNNTQIVRTFICDYCDSCSCFYCFENAKRVCSFCKKMICLNCSKQCQYCIRIFCKDNRCIKEAIQNCIKCTNTFSKLNFYSCNHDLVISCSFCYPKCEGCNINLPDEKCNCCDKPICLLSCAIKCSKCHKINCAKCSSHCSICKKIICDCCSKFCNNCGKDTFTICDDCNCNLIRKCTVDKCFKYLCISCWNVCNYCNVIMCDDHALTCTNCEEKMCELHYHTCYICSNKEELKYKKLCLKNCTLKCSFCHNISNVLCRPERHFDDLVSNYGCEHNCCLSCVKKCENCNKIVKTCMECIKNYYYIQCKYCNKYLCDNCALTCDKCEEEYCGLEHTCFCCKRRIKNKQCLSCLDILKKKCQYCYQKLTLCKNCNNVYICSIQCYLNYRTIVFETHQKNPLCSMFYCENHLAITNN